MINKQIAIGVPRYMKCMSTKELLDLRGRNDFNSWDKEERVPIVKELRRRVKRNNPKSPLVSTKVRI